jgi:hypothetical protein
MNETTTGILEVNRPSMYFAKFRAYPIFVDGEKVGSVKDGAVLTVPLSPGGHEVWSKIDWKKSNTTKIRIEAGITTKIRVGYKKKEGRRLLVPVALGLLSIMVGATFGIAILTVIGVVGIFMARVGDLYLDEDVDT